MTSNPNGNTPTQIANDNTPTDDEAPVKPKRLGQEPIRPPLPKRFYKEVAVATIESGYTVHLDGRAIKTPKKSALIVPTRALAAAMAAEWQAQGKLVDPETMPLTRLANTALDAVTRELAAVRADIVAFAGTDALCYRADAPSELVALQTACWDPILAWAAQDLGATLQVTSAIQHKPQSPIALAAVAKTLDSFDAWQITALHVMTTLTGSAVLALAVGHHHLAVEQAWTAAHIDEDWQALRWGADEEAQTRRAYRLSQIQAASHFLSTLR
jgi:chaperone required for assembly of F1-ATPase